MLHIALLNKMDRVSRGQVVSNGIVDGCEYLKAYDLRSGWIHNGGSRSPRIVAIPGDLEGLLRDPFAELYIHHNHPDGVSFSRGDLALALDVGNRARGKLFAHGHDGSTYGVALANRESIEALHRRASDSVERTLRSLVFDSQVPMQVAKIHFAHVICQALDVAGVIHYEFAVSKTRIDEWQRYANYLEEAVTAAADAVGR